MCNSAPASYSLRKHVDKVLWTIFAHCNRSVWRRRERFVVNHRLRLCKRRVVAPIATKIAAKRRSQCICHQFIAPVILEQDNLLYYSSARKINIRDNNTLAIYTHVRIACMRLWLSREYRTYLVLVHFRGWFHWRMKLTQASRFALRLTVAQVSFLLVIS